MSKNDSIGFIPTLNNLRNRGPFAGTVAIATEAGAGAGLAYGIGHIADNAALQSNRGMVIGAVASVALSEGVFYLWGSSDASQQADLARRANRALEGKNVAEKATFLAGLEAAVIAAQTPATPEATPEVVTPEAKPPKAAKK